MAALQSCIGFCLTYCNTLDIFSVSKNQSCGLGIVQPRIIANQQSFDSAEIVFTENTDLQPSKWCDHEAWMTFSRPDWQRKRL